MLCLVFAVAGPVMPGAGDVSPMDPTMAYGAAPNMLVFAPDGGAGFDLEGQDSFVDFLVTVQPAAARWTVSTRLGFIPNTHWQLGRTIDVPLGGTISRYAPTGFYSGILHVLASALVTYFISINCDFKQHFRTGLHVTVPVAPKGCYGTVT